MPADSDVDAAIAALFHEHGQAFQALNEQAAKFQNEFVESLAEAGNAYEVVGIAHTPEHGF